MAPVRCARESVAPASHAGDHTENRPYCPLQSTRLPVLRYGCPVDTFRCGAPLRKGSGAMHLVAPYAHQLFWLLPAVKINIIIRIGRKRK